MSDEVKIVVNQEGRGNALSETAEKIKQLRAEAEKLRANADAYAQKYGFNDSTASSARAEAAGLEKEANRLERPILREQSDARRRTDRAAKEEAKERKQIEQEITEEQRRQEKVFNARMRAAGTIGAVAVAGGGVMAQDYFAHQGIAIKDRQSRRAAEREMGLHATRGYSAGEAITDVRGTEDRIFDGQNNRETLENNKTKGIIAGALAGLVAGAGTGAAVGSVVPGVGTAIGAGAGALIGAGAGAFGGHLHGKQAIAENEKELQRNTELLAKQKAEQQARFNAEIRPQLDARKAMLNFDMQAKRFAEDRVTAVKEYNAILKNGGDEALAKESAIDAVRSKQRERAGNVLSLVGARTGNRGAAQLARIAGGLDDPARAAEVFKAAIEPLHNTVKTQAQPLKNFQVRSLN